MYTKSIFGSALVALSSVSTVLAGTAQIKNECSFDVYLWSVANSYNVDMKTIPSGGAPYTEDYRINPDGGGISIKISPEQTQDHITQLEYTKSDTLIFYDMSNINGAPFQSGGMTLAPTAADCPTVKCPAGVLCTDAYINPDDTATKGCSVDTDLILTLCPGGSGGDATSGSSASSPAPTEAAVNSPVPTTLVTSASSTTTTATATATEDLKFRPVAQKERRSRRHVHGHPHA